MAKVICTLPNASTEINGVKFVSHKLGMISEDVDDDVAKSFATIRGYHHYDPKTKGIAVSTDASTSGSAGTDNAGAGAELGFAPLVPTPESLAASAAAFTPVARGQLIDLLVAQQKAKPPAPAANTGKPDPKAAASAPAAAGAPAPVKTAPAAGAGGAPNPTF